MFRTPWRLSGNHLYVAYGGSATNDTVAEYDVTTGNPVPGFTSPTGLQGPSGLAVSGNDLYVACQNDNTLREFDATTGAAVPGFIEPGNLGTPGCIAVSPMTNIKWLPLSNAHWDTPANWDLQGTPDSTSNVYITPTVALMVTGPAALDHRELFNHRFRNRHRTTLFATRW